MTFIVVGGAVAVLFHTGYILSYLSQSAWTGVGLTAIVFFLVLHAFYRTHIQALSFELLIVLPLSLVAGAVVGAVNAYVLFLPPLLTHLATFANSWNIETPPTSNLASESSTFTLGWRIDVWPFVASVALIIIFVAGLFIDDPYDLSQTRAVTTGIVLLFIGLILFVVSLVLSTALDRRYIGYLLVLLLAPAIFILFYHGSFWIVILAIILLALSTCALLLIDMALTNTTVRVISPTSDPRTNSKTAPRSVFIARWIIGVWAPLTIAWIGFLIAHIFIRESSGGWVLLAMSVPTLSTVPFCYWIGRVYAPPPTPPEYDAATAKSNADLEAGGGAAGKGRTVNSTASSHSVTVQRTVTGSGTIPVVNGVVPGAVGGNGVGGGAYDFDF